MDNRFQCGCEVGRDCTKATMCMVQCAIESEKEKIEDLQAVVDAAIVYVNAVQMAHQVPYSTKKAHKRLMDEVTEYQERQL